MQVGRLLRLALCVGMLTVPSFAALVLDFSGAGAGSGTLTGGVGTATGSNILIDTLTTSGGTLHDGTFAVTGGALNFTATGGTYAGGGIYNYTGGTYNITGSIAAPVNASGALLTGTISSLTINFSTQQVVIATGSDTKSTALLTYFICASGTCPNQWNFMGGTTHLNNISGGTGGSFSATTFSTDIPNDYVPEPASIVLLGTVVVGVTQVIRRRRATKTSV